MRFNLISYMFVLMQLIAFTFPSFAPGCENEDRIQTAVKALGHNNPFIYYDLHLSETEEVALNALKINSTEEYNNYGNLENLGSEVRSFLKKLGNDNEITEKTVSELVIRLVAEVLQGSEQETAWVAIRAFTAMSEFDTPRWHTDGYYFEPYEGNPYKFAITLRGPSTLFYNLPENKREKFYTLQYTASEQNNYNRNALTDFLGDTKEAISTGTPSQGVVFIVGSDDSAVHSEPLIKEERLFLSVLPGTKKQITEWENKQN